MTEDTREIPSRRRFLKYAGATASIAAVGVAGWELFGGDGEDRGPVPNGEAPTDAPTGAPTDGNPETASGRDYPYTDRFESVVDVAARGGDPGGEEPINDLLEANLADDTLFYFPEGTFRVDGPFAVQHHDNVGFVGPAATLRPADGRIGDWLVADGVSRFLFEGFTLSNVAERTAVRTKVHVSGGENVVRDVAVVGFQDVPTRTHGFTIQVNGADTTLRMENVELIDGARNGTGMFVHPANEPGTLHLVDCRIENWYEQGLYGSSHGGPMYVVGGRYANNGKAQVRVGGGRADTEAVVRDVSVEMSDPQPADAKGNVWGIWLHEGEGTLVENCEVSVTNLSSVGSSGAIVLGAEQGTTTIRDTSVRVDDSTFGIAATSPKESGFVIPSMEEPPENWQLTAENVTITGNADRDVGVWIVDRPGCTLRDLTIDQGGTSRDGIGLLRSPGAEISGLSCSTSGVPVLASVPGDVGDCLLSIEGIETLESGADGADGRNATGTSTGDESVTPAAMAAGTGGTSGALQETRETLAVAASDGRYCFDAATIAGTDAWPALGVTRLAADRLHVRRFPESALNPY